ncbi:MBL fold metallo-hydrolase [Pseudomaricurvus alkylphenolicus]|uniref:MBL fold metallo-hydrolase n=1 Tax=Pseudomaricurvus alkylphenolicus TaxID=1306991 RepID=UPI0014241550|nr:MBL fold metallo-hydrolase [Pseudomaricurvus alkylphenolicus]NIB42446.1 MBL fold metallo-hydrolase [Pseudomaricurvus alkylphenolicus]
MIYRLVSILVGIAVVFAVAFWLVTTTTTDPALDPNWQIQAANYGGDKEAVTVRFTGTSTLLFDDGETRWMTDGWFTRLSWLQLLGDFEPDLAAIEAGLKANNVDSMEAVIPLHSHFDHAMDSAAVAERTDALLMGTHSTANLGRGWGLPEFRIKVMNSREEIPLGKFTITPILSKHYEFPGSVTGNTVETIDEPVGSPTNLAAYKEGGSWALHVSHPRGSWLIIGSAGYIEGGLDDYKADTVFLGIGGLGGQTQEYREQYWHESVETVGAKRVIPIHWDCLVCSLNEPFEGQTLFFRYLFEQDFLLQADKKLLQFLKTKEADVEFITLPRFDPVKLW